MSNPANFKQFNPKRSRRQYKTRPVADRFWEKVHKTKTCWLWTAYKNPLGYGQFGVGYRVVYAHRFSYEIHKGVIPDGLELDHLCRVPSCVNPEHLEAVTRRENHLRGNHPSIQIYHSGRCGKGHERTPENTYIWSGNPRKRFCRVCKKLFMRKWKKKNASQV